MLEITDLYKQYGDTVAANVSNLTIAQGERVGIVGNNGAGKTTIISLILDLIKSDRGTILMDGYNVVSQEDWKPHVAAFLDESFVIDYLTPDEYFGFLGRIRNLPQAEIEERLLPLHEFFNDQILGQKKYIRDLSKGNKKKVGIAGAMLAQPKLLILDEPFANLDPSSQYMLQQIISNVSKEQTILVSSHDLSHISEVCDRIIIVEDGAIVKDLKKNENTLLELKSYFAAKSEADEI